FVEVLEQKSKALLLLVGGGKDLPELQRRAADLAASHRIRFLGQVPTEQIPLYYRLGEVSVDPRRDSIPARSSLSLKLVESIAAGVPCITTDVGDRRQVLGSAGIAVAPGDPHLLAEAILSVLDDPERAKVMRAAAAQIRKSLFWDQRVSQLISVYEKR
ncbi:MAG: glycosyltransferase, partial [bacterium]